MGRPIPDARFDRPMFGEHPWQLIAEDASLTLARTPALFSLGNGFIGVRGPGHMADERKTFLNGVFEKVPIPYHEAAFGYARESDMRLSVADATRPKITIDGIAAGDPVRVELDMLGGRRIEHFLLRDVPVALETIVSMTHRQVVTYRVTVPFVSAERVSVEPAIIAPPGSAPPAEALEPYDPRVSPHLNVSPWRELASVKTPSHRARLDHLPTSGFCVAVACAIIPGHEKAATEATFDGFAAYVAQREEGALEASLAALDAARTRGFDALAKEQSEWFAEHWQASLISLPDTRIAEQALHHAQFQLVQAVDRTGTGSIAAKGQTGEGYEGHIFWDADLYVLPVFAFTRPEIARAMLVWRIGGLEAARGNARAMGQTKSALYPWRTIAGGECSSFFPAGSAQYHINADIAFALRTYLDATGDTTILDDGGALMLVETARIWLEIGYHDPARGEAFVINQVTGPDEYSALVDNNFYTNLMAAEHLRDAARIGADAGLITAEEATRMRRAADAMYLPFDQERGIPAQDDAFFARQPWPFADTPASDYPLLLHYHPLTIYRHRVAKQADAVLAMTLLRDKFEAPVRERMLDEYAAVTVHDSTLSASVFATAAAHLGDAERALSYWSAAVLTDLGDLFANSGHGLHMAALAGSWTAMAMGFAGMRVVDDGLTFDPIAIPGLGRYTFRTRFRGALIEISVDDRDASYQLIEGQAPNIRHFSKAVNVSPSPQKFALAR